MLATSWQPARAEFALAFDDLDTTGVDIIIEDGSTFDLDDIPGAIEYCHSSLNFVTCTAATSKPAAGTASRPEMGLNVEFIKYTGNLRIMATDTDFTSGDATAFTNANGFIEGGVSVTFDFFGDSNNQAFEPGFLINSFGPVNQPDFSIWFDDESPAGPVGSLTIAITLPAGSGAETDMNGSFFVGMDLVPSDANVDVPNVVGLEQSAAEDAIEVAGFAVGSVTTQTSTTVDAGDVISQDPSAGASVPPGSQVSLVVSTGEGQAEVPEPAGLAGLWFDPAFDGEGYSVLVTSSGIFLYYYGHDATGKRLWLISDSIAGPISFGQSIEFTMHQGSGTFADPSPDLDEWGTMVLIFDSCTAGRAQMTGNDGTKKVDITKLTGIGDLDCDG